MKLAGNKFVLSVFSSLLLILAWQPNFSFLIFIAFVPLLLIEDEISASASTKKKLKIFGFSYLVFALWNVGVTWWVYYASAGGSLMAFFPNALLMGIIFLIFSNLKNRIGSKWGIWIFIPVWLAFEYGHSVWDLAWIWLNLGNVFCWHPNWMQWYEFTGSSGGSLWVLIVNVLIFSAIKNTEQQKNKLKWIGISLSLILPIAMSYLILGLRSPLNENRKNVVIVQPNIDPYNEKFDLDYESQFRKMLKLIQGKVNSETDYLVLPETFITGIEWFGVNENEIEKSEEIKWFRDSLISRFPQLKIVVGASSYLIYKDEKSATATSRKDRSGIYFDCFNTAFQIDKDRVQLYHKSKLVPGVERMPFPALFKPLENLAIDLGGTSGSLGTQTERANFYDENNKSGIAPVICYESVFSDYVSGYIRKGADFIFIITNDGWWSDSPGHIQHLNYARIRAVETRRQIARSANTGISCVIDEFGSISQATEYWKEAVISAQIFGNSEQTFFTKFGDLISYISVILTGLCLSFSIWLRFTKGNK